MDQACRIIMAIIAVGFETIYEQVFPYQYSWIEVGLLDNIRDMVA